MKFKVSSGLNIAASSWGLESDPLVVLLHGGGQTRHAWGETGEKLSKSGFHVLAPVSYTHLTLPTILLV